LLSNCLSILYNLFTKNLQKDFYSINLFYYIWSVKDIKLKERSFGLTS